MSIIMTASLVREHLHKYIDGADDQKLQAIYSFVTDDMDGPNYAIDEETINMLEERRADYLKGNDKGLSMEESVAFINSELAKRGL